MPARTKSATKVAIPTLPVREGTAYPAEEVAPVITAFLAAHGITRTVSGLDVRNVVRGKRKGVASPVPRLLVRPAFGNRAHDYTLTEAADVLRTFARLAGLADVALPAPFAGRESGATAKRPATRKNAKVTATGPVRETTAQRRLRETGNVPPNGGIVAREDGSAV